MEMNLAFVKLSEKLQPLQSKENMEQFKKEYEAVLLDKWNKSK